MQLFHNLDMMWCHAVNLLENRDCTLNNIFCRTVALSSHSWMWECKKQLVSTYALPAGASLAADMANIPPKELVVQQGWGSRRPWVPAHYGKSVMHETCTEGRRSTYSDQLRVTGAKREIIPPAWGRKLSGAFTVEWMLIKMETHECRMLAPLYDGSFHSVLRLWQPIEGCCPSNEVGCL